MCEKKFVGYEYHEINVKRSMISVYTDAYENFGWQLEKIVEQSGTFSMDSATLKFKRDRKICNKAELTRLQRNFDACIAEIHSLETSKRTIATAAAYIVGIIGTAFMAGSVFAVTADKIVLCVILAIPAFIGWLLPYFIYKNIEKKKSTQVTPLIDKKYDEIYNVCEKANHLLNSMEK